LRQIKASILEIKAKITIKKYDNLTIIHQQREQTVYEKNSTQINFKISKNNLLSSRSSLSSKSFKTDELPKNP
jgi:hypothetical protein